MKFSEFAALCSREWMTEPRGEVCALGLTEDSLAELTADAAAEGRISVAGADGEAAWLPPTELVSPVTRAVVRVSLSTTTYDTYQSSRGVPYQVLRYQVLR